MSKKGGYDVNRRNRPSSERFIQLCYCWMNGPLLYELRATIGRL